MKNNSILTPVEACAYMGISMASLYRLFRTNKLPRTKISGRYVGIYQEDLDTYLSRKNSPKTLFATLIQQGGNNNG